MTEMPIGLSSRTAYAPSGWIKRLSIWVTRRRRMVITQNHKAEESI